MDNSAPTPPAEPTPENDTAPTSKFSVARVIAFALFVLPIVIVANLAIWAAFNQPHEAEAWTGEIVGFSYSPYQRDQDPTKNQHPTQEQISRDLKLISGTVQAIRTYSAIRGQENIPELAAEDGLSVAVGAWISGDKPRNDEELKNLIALAKKRNVVRVLVGNESLLRNDLPVAELVDYIKAARAAGVWKPISTAEPPHIWLNNPDLVKAVDYIGVQILPYWEGIPVDRAVDAVFERLDELHKKYPDKPIVITEVGWPSRGKIIPRRPYPGIPEAELSGEAVPSLVNQATFLREFLNRAKDADITYYVMEAFDQPWKVSEEGAAGAYWGIYDANRNPKFPMKGSISEAPQWRIWASIAAGLALVFAVAFMMIRQHVKPAGVIIFTIVTQIAASAFAWAGLSVTGLYLSSVDTVVWSFLFAAQGLLLMVLLAEAIEFVEVIWTRHGERHFTPFAHPDGHYPSNKVSIHVPIHNEPPEMVRETLLALSRLDYKNFEVLVLDNNTVDPKVWQPVRETCAELGPHFRFFHLENWPGFKAGALNFGLKMTAEDADIIAVIDSDYQVAPDWLRTMVPYFVKEDIGFVQSPQDYRDGHESMFKNMCNWEYAGFFHIGMVQRNYFNAVIQHGTMTLVRKSALIKVGAWAEWCICEDAELGIKLYREGYDSVYINHSFGKGLTPDTLAGYIGQRFRWAYGAVQIVKHHWRSLAPWATKGGLTSAQRYYFLAGWLPWFADGLALLFTITSVGLSAFALLYPKMVQLPVAAFLIPTIGSFVFKFVRSLWLYAVRVKDCSFIESLGAGVAALGLTHTVAKAMLNGMVTSGKPFFRTPKCEDKPPFAAAIIQVREEAVMLVLLWGLAAAFLLNANFADSLSRLWVAVLLVQSVPYAAAVLLSFINVLPALFKSKPAPSGALSAAE